jgi:DNA (cytosine-5)-methyltransferase 1|nr:MAG TPA: Cytosine specific methyltransferase [Bacteriophage sp.]
MEVLGSIYTEVSDRFQKGIIGGISRCVKAEKHDLGVVLMEQIILDGSQRGLENGKWRTYTDIMPSITAREYKEPRSVMEVIQIGNIAEEKNFSNPQTGRIYDVGGCSPTLSTMQGGNQEPKILESQIVAMRGRNPDNPSDRTVGNPTEQRLEVNMQGTSNCLTSVQKDNLLLENNIQKVGQISSNGSQCGTVISDNGISANLVAGTHGYANNHIATQYRIRKLTPRECGRLMGVSDEDISKMAAVNSNTQLYKQFGNSIVVDVMCAMFKNLNIKQGD